MLVDRFIMDVCFQRVPGNLLQLPDDSCFEYLIISIVLNLCDGLDTLYPCTGDAHCRRCMVNYEEGLYSTFSPRSSIRTFASFKAHVCILESGL